MKIIRLKFIMTLAIIFCALGHASITLAWSAGNGRPGPVLPAGCENIAVPDGHKVAYRVYALGVQIYRWNGSAWAFVGPEANLYADPRFRGKIGTHYVGPAWETKSGSIVFGASPVACTPDPNSIAWLRLVATSSHGPGVLDGVTYIQRINTKGGLRPTEPGTTIDEEVGVPYTTEYYFYKAEN